MKYVFLVLGLLVMGCADAKVASEAGAQGRWLQDEKTGCRLWAPDAAFASVSWPGDCTVGLASGSATAHFSTGVSPAFDRPLTAEFHGHFERGKAQGQAIILYGGGLAEIATYANGGRVGEVTLHVLDHGNDAWLSLPAAAMPPLGGKGLAGTPPELRPIFPNARPFLPNPAQPDRQLTENLLAFEHYSDLDAARAAVFQEFPKGKKAPELLATLDTAARVPGMVTGDMWEIYYDPPRASQCKHTATLATAPGLSWFCILSFRQPRPYGNVDRWVYTVIMNEDAEIVETELRRYYQGLNFKARQVPLHAEDFATPTDFIGAALELLGPRPSEEQVTVLMQSAGLDPGSSGIPFSEGSKDPDVEILEFSGAGTGMLFFVTGCTNTIHVIWTVDKKTGTVEVKNPEEFHTAIGACL